MVRKMTKRHIFINTYTGAYVLYDTNFHDKIILTWDHKLTITGTMLRSNIVIMSTSGVDLKDL